ncbi:MAG: glycosyltransferase family 2 protein [Planctomycetota bacterium]
MALSVVMPVYNEEDSIEAVVGEWTEELNALKVPYEFCIYDDGSKDSTPKKLESLCARHPAVRIIKKENEGHGPTILRGYREAEGRWILQIDSDGEIRACHFGEIWDEREKYDIILGVRQGRRSSVVRRIITGAARLTVRLLFGKALRDVNTPYRLMRREALRKLLPRVPARTMAPNVALSGLAARRGLRICEFTVPHEGRRGGRPSLLGLKVWEVALRSFGETLRIAAGTGKQRRRDRTP